MDRRLQRFQSRLVELGLEAFLITHPANRRYVSGFDGSSGVLLICPEKAFLATDSRYLEQAGLQSPHCILVSSGETGLAAALRPVVEENKLNRVAFEEKHLVYASYREYSQEWQLELLPHPGLAEEMRRNKEPAEVQVLDHGAALLDAAFLHILEYLAPGRTEAEVSLELELFLRRRGSSGVPFRFIVASGTRGAFPHGVATPKILQRGELVTIDFGAVVDGYATDCTRTVCLGPPDGRQQEIYACVQEAQEKARFGVEPGMACREADALAREVIVAAGYGQYFGHGLGHGVGLEVHEQPILSPRGEGNLLPGTVFTVEPGIYIPGWGGVRIEDMMIMEKEGARALTRSTRELVVI